MEQMDEALLPKPCVVVAHFTFGTKKGKHSGKLCFGLVGFFLKDKTFQQQY